MEKCQGRCEEHRGDIKKVSVVDNTREGKAFDWGEFWYCSEAIKTDRANGLTVKEVEVR